MEKNRIIKKRFHDEANIVEDNEPATKKQKIEAMPIASISNLPTEIKEKIIKNMHIDTLFSMGRTSHFFKNLVIKHCFRQIKNPFAVFSSCMQEVDTAINTLIDVWLHGEIEIDYPGENLYVKDHNTKEDLLPKIDYDTQDFLNEYGLIFNLIKDESIVNEKFFFKNLLIQIQQRGLDINTQGPSGQTLLHFYCDVVDGIDNDTLTSIKALIEIGANIFLEDFFEQTPLQKLIFRFVQNYIDSKELTEKNTFPIILVELMLKQFDKAKVIHALVNSLNDQEDFIEYVAPLLKSFLFLNQHPDGEIASLFKTNVEKSLRKKDLLEFLDIKKSPGNINLSL